MTDGCHDEIRPVCREGFVNCSMLRFLAEWAWHLFLENGEDYMKYPMVVEKDRVTSCRNSPVASEGVQGNLTPGAEPNIDKLPEGVDENEDWDFDGAISGESSQYVGMKRKLQKLQDEGRSKN